MAQNVKITFGMDSVTKSNYSSTQDILNDSSLSAFLGFDASRVDTYVNGSQYSGLLQDGDVVTLNTKSNTKG